MRIFKCTKLMIALSASLVLLSACDSKKDEAVAVDQDSKVAVEAVMVPVEEVQTIEAVEEPTAASNFVPENYYDISQADGAGTVAQLYINMAASQLKDEEFAVAHNIDGADSKDAFERKAAFEKVKNAKAVAAAYQAQKMLVVAMLPGNLFDQLRAEEGITSISTGGLKLLEYDFDKKAFPYTYTYDQSCQNTTQVYNNIPSEANFIKTGNGGFNTKGVEIQVDRDRMMSKTCYFDVPDQAVAAAIEKARSEGKIVFTGKAYLTAKNIGWADRGSDGVSTTINANLDSEELYLHTLEADGSLSAPLAEHKFIF